VSENLFKALSFQMKEFLLRRETTDILRSMIEKKAKNSQFGQLYMYYVEDFLNYVREGAIPDRIKVRKEIYKNDLS
jgi:hypothetical protein